MNENKKKVMNEKENETLQTIMNIVLYCIFITYTI